jgi:hypothetical protein
MRPARRTRVRNRASSALLAVALAAAGASVAACGSSDGATSNVAPTFSGAPFATASSDGGLRIEARSAPEAAPARGVNQVELTVSDESGATREGLVLDVVLWMSAMGHGASVKPTVTAQGGGRYVHTNVDFFMPGRWELRTTISGATEDHAIIIVPIS